MKHSILKLCLITTMGLLALAPTKSSAWQSDNGDGTYTNPPLYADYPDPDITRVGNDFYFATTTFVNSPGLSILHSQDLVNWEIVSHVIPRLDGKEQYDMKNGQAYRSGVFAPSIRYFKGTFYVVTTLVGQNTRIYYSTDIAGPWKFHELDRPAFDPGFFIDADGTGYIATSGGWDGHVTLLQLNQDYSQVVSSTPIFYYEGVEGSKVVKRGDWYYIFNAIPRKLGLACSRAKNIHGPYETIEPLNDGTGGHQGAIVDLPNGDWYGFVMKDSGAIGRMTFISPIFWKENWPVWGTPEAPGKVPAAAPKPILNKPLLQPATSDDFQSPTLGLQWQWNHNPDDTKWSLSERPGYLRLMPTIAPDFWTARNTLTQKGQGPYSRAEINLDLTHLKPGDTCGFGTLGKDNGHIRVNCGGDGKLSLAMTLYVDGGTTEERVVNQPYDGSSIFLRTEMDFKNNKGRCSYSSDGTTWTPLGGDFEIAYDWQHGTFQGEQFAIFCFNSKPSDGFVDLKSFHFSDKTP